MQVLMNRGFSKEDIVAKMPELKAAMVAYAEANRYPKKTLFI